MTNNLLSVIIDRSKWSTGNPNSMTKFWTRDKSGSSNFMETIKGGFCCLGFACEALGAEYLIGIGHPRVLIGAEKTSKEISGKIYDTFLSNRLRCDTTQELIEANDDSFYTDAERELRIKLGFEVLGLEAIFVGEYPY